MVSWFGSIYANSKSFIGYDGYNGFMYRNGSLFHYKNPPLDIVFSAFIQQYIGNGETIERGMFAVFSVLSIFIYILIMKRIQANSLWKKTAFILFVLNINFLLFGNESRYYSLTYFFGLAIFYLLHLLTTEISFKQHIIQISIAILLLLFYFTHYVQALIWLMIIIQYIIIRFKRNEIIQLKVLFIGLILTLAISIYHGYQMDILNRADLENQDTFYVKYTKLVYWYIGDVHRFCIFSLAAFIPFFIKKFRQNFYQNSNNVLLIYQILLFSILMIVLSPQDTSRSSMYDMRYLQSGLFLFAMLYASIFDTFIEIKWLKKRSLYLVCFLLLSSNILYTYRKSETLDIVWSNIREDESIHHSIWSG